MATWAVILLGAWQSKFYFLGFVAVTIAFIAYVLVRDTPASCGLPVIEDYKKDYLELNDQEVSEKLKTSDIFLRYIWGNKLLWYIAFANIFIYLVRYGVLDWAPTYLKEVKGYSLEESGWAYFMYEYAGIPGTLLCGWMSDTLFKGKRSPATIMYMLFVLLAVVVYWKNPPGHFWIDQFALIAIGFFIYGPVMLIGVFALDLVPKNVAGTAAGFTGLFGYLGGSVFANIALGFILERWQWNGGFMVLVTACVLAILLMLPTWRQEIIHSKGLNLEK
jgi:OPA family glycerol-3-phosphate transporter-like MFS transporter